jgi:DNA repair protein RadC
MADKESKKSVMLREMLETDKPRERLQQVGSENLTSAELLAVILGVGSQGETVTDTAQRMLQKFGGLQGISRATVEELRKVRGVGVAKACRLKAVFELANRRDIETGKKTKAVIKTPEEAYNQLKARALDKQKEFFWAIFLDTRNQAIKTAEISVGSLDSSIVHPRELFKEAVAASASSVIIAHNHPSGNPEASQDDIQLTRRLMEVGKIMGIEIVDHIILGDGRFVSLKREGMF